MNRVRSIPPIDARVALHRTYLRDGRRNAAYQEAIRSVVDNDTVVLDLGCGSGILSFFAVQAGCRKVYALERSPFIRHAEAVAQRNGFAGKIEFVHADIFDAQLPERVDLIIHDQIGSFVWEEEMVEKLKHARSTFLNPDGVILPYEVELSLVPLQYPPTYLDSDFWRTPIHGIDFSDLAELEERQSAELARPRLVFLDAPDGYLASPCAVATTNLYQDDAAPTAIHAEIEVTSAGVCTGILGMFVIRLTPGVSLSTAPARPGTNWGQFILPVFPQRRCRPGDRLLLDLELARSHQEWTWSVTYA
jgi:SAM-dependent methyltransferase